MTLPESVTIALTSAEELGWMLDRIDVTDADHAVWVACEAQMLEHWAGLAAEEASYPALAAGLSEFSRAVLRGLSAADAEGG